MLKFYIKTFNSLTRDELYNILKLRAEVFVVEQNCVYQDVDDKDQKALHVLGYKNNQLVAYARLFKPNDYFLYASIGRVLVVEKERQHKYGFELMQTAIMAIDIHYKTHTIAISAQEHLKKFYNNLGFFQQGEGYLEDGIPHIFMMRS
jgi:ElaA protein